MIELSPKNDLLAALLQNEVAAICCEIDGRLTTAAPRPAIILSGSFNPVHEGHWRLFDVASRRSSGAAAFELSALNVDKPPLDQDEIRCRLQPFIWRAPVWLTRAATFAEKAALFPGAVFVIGADTAERLLSLRYYAGSELRMAEAFDSIRAHGCRFLVGGRQNHEGKLVSLEDLGIADTHRDLFTGISKTEFFHPLSSTALRALINPQS